MSRAATFIICIFSLLLFACKVSQQHIPGTYRLRNEPGTHLVLRKDGSFAFAKIFSRPGKTIFGDSTEENFCSSGTWKYDQHRLILTGDPNSRRYDEARSLETSYSHASNTSFSFWDQYGDPVPVRFFSISDRIKFHRNNVVSFPPDELNSRDTLQFHFFGYSPFIWRANTHSADTGAVHAIVLMEKSRPDFFRNLELKLRRNKIIDPLSRVKMKKTN